MYGFLLLFLVAATINILLLHKNRKLNFLKDKMDDFQHDLNSSFIAMILALESLKDYSLKFENIKESNDYLSLVNILNEGMKEITENLRNLNNI
jgi:hypothetical protein